MLGSDEVERHLMYVDNRTLADKIEKAIRAIPAQNPGYISSHSETLGRLLSPAIIREIARVAAKVVEQRDT